MSKITGQNLLDVIKNKSKNLEGEMSFFEHLEVLRWHLIRSAIAVVVFMGVAWSYFDVIFDKVIMGPKNLDFWTYRMICSLGQRFNLGDDLCIDEIPIQIINIQMAGQFTLQMNASLLIGIMAGFPYLLYEIWRFIKPALSDVERKSASGFVFYASLLFAIGVLFGYYVITPLSIKFLANWQVSSEIVNQITMSSYLSTVATITIGAGIIFELPIVIYILSKIGIMTPQFMRSSRRYAIIIILVISAIVTPTPDALTLLSVAFPMLLLYELSIVLAARVYKQKQKEQKEFFNS